MVPVAHSERAPFTELALDGRHTHHAILALKVLRSLGAGARGAAGGRTIAVFASTHASSSSRCMRYRRCLGGASGFIARAFSVPSLRALRIVFSEQPWRSATCLTVDHSRSIW